MWNLYVITVLIFHHIELFSSLYASYWYMFIMKAAYRIGGRSINAYTIEHSILGFRSHRPTQVDITRGIDIHTYALNTIDIMKYWQSMWSMEFTHSIFTFLSSGCKVCYYRGPSSNLVTSGDRMRLKIQNLSFALHYAAAGGQILRYAVKSFDTSFWYKSKLRTQCGNVIVLTSIFVTSFLLVFGNWVFVVDMVENVHVP